MTEIPQTNQLQNPNLINPAGVYQNTPVVNTQNGQTVTVNPYPSTIYQYPQSSVYDTNSKQAASGVNIYIYNPSGYGAPSTNTCYGPFNYPNGAQMTYPGATQISYETPASTPLNNDGNQPIPASPVSGDTTEEKNGVKKKQVTELSDDYIKMLESYLTNSNVEIRRQGIEDLIKRFEEDDSREKHPALTALLNIALQDPNSSNRLLAMSPIVAEVAAGDKNTETLLQNLTKSDKVYGQEAKTASNALLKVTRKNQ